MKSESVGFGVGSPGAVWAFAPPRSASTSITRLPRWASAIERLVETSVLPIPPLPPPTATIRRGRERLCNAGGRAGGADRGNSMTLLSGFSAGLVLTCLVDHHVAGAGPHPRAGVGVGVEADEAGAAVGGGGAPLARARAGAALAGAGGHPRGDHARVAGAAVGRRGAH